MSSLQGAGPKDIRILYQSFGPPANRAYLESLRVTLDAASRACAVEVDIGTLRDSRLAEKQHRAFHLAAGAELLREVHRAEATGHAAVVIGNIQDPALYECRQVCAIPVVGLLGSVLSTTRPFGARIGLVTTGHLTIPLLRERILIYGERDRVASVRAAGVALPDLLRSFEDVTLRAAIIARFRDVAARTVEDGAELVVAASGMLAELLNAASRERLDLGVQAPVLDPITVAVAAAAAAARLASAGASISRIGTYAAPPPEDLDAFFARRPGPA